MAGVSTHATLPTNLVSYYEFEEESSTRVDSAGSNDLTDVATVLYGTGIQGNAADFESGSSEYFKITDAAQSGLDLTGDFSFSWWSNFESLSSAAGIVNKWLNFDDRSYITQMVSTTSFNLLLDSDGTDTASLNHTHTFSAITADGTTWYHFVLTYIDSTHVSEFWIDGVSQGELSSGASGIADAGADVNIGSISANTFYDGLMDELGIWSKTLSDSEISDLYNSGAGIPYIDTSVATPPSNLGLLGVG